MAELLYKNSCDVLVECMKKRKRHTGLSGTQLKEVLMLSPRLMDNQLMMEAVEVKGSQSYEKSLTFNRADEQIKAGLYIVKRIRAYLRKIVMSSKTSMMEIEKATDHEILKQGTT